MDYSCRYYFGFLSAALMMGAASAAVAQESNSLPPSGLSSVPAGAYREWPGTPSLATGPESANGDVIDSQGGGAIPPLPLEAQTKGGITYITGGVGDEELAQIKSSEHEYNLHMLMSAPGGAFISDVSLHITDASGKELVAVDGAGPYFYAKLAPGSYGIDLNDGSESKKIVVKIGKSSVKKLVEFKETGGVVTPHQPTATVD